MCQLDRCLPLTDGGSLIGIAPLQEEDCGERHSPFRFPGGIDPFPDARTPCRKRMDHVVSVLRAQHKGQVVTPCMPRSYDAATAGALARTTLPCEQDPESVPFHERCVEGRATHCKGMRIDGEQKGQEGLQCLLWTRPILQLADDMRNLIVAVVLRSPASAYLQVPLSRRASSGSSGQDGPVASSSGVPHVSISRGQERPFRPGVRPMKCASLST